MFTIPNAVGVPTSTLDIPQVTPEGRGTPRFRVHWVTANTLHAFATNLSHAYAHDVGRTLSARGRTSWVEPCQQ